jgi:Protein of unknown function (DUF3108)
MLMRTRTRFATAWPLAGAIIAWTAAGASAASLNAEYAISLAGLSVGSADLSANLDGGGYKMDIQARLTGIAGALTGGSGGAAAAGTVSGARPLPSGYAVTSRTSRDQRTVRLTLRGGNVTAVDIAPPIDDHEGRVPVREAHKRGILDPVSALLMPAFGRGDPLDPAACNRTLPIFDGAARFDVALSYAETRIVEKPGYSGPVIVCNARYLPVAGHRPDRPGTKFMEENRDLSVWLAPVEGTRVLMPMRISIRTTMGTSVIEAIRWSQDAGKAIPISAKGGRARTQ